MEHERGEVKQQLPAWHRGLFVWTARIFIVVGLMYTIGLVNFGIKSRSVQAEIAQIWERQVGIEYQSVGKGSYYPCKIDIKISSNSEYVMGTGERHPCKYYVGQIIQVRYDARNKSFVIEYWKWLIWGVAAMGMGFYLQRRMK